MDDNTEQHSEDTSFLGKHRFLLLIALSITISLVLVSISMTLYVTSGAAQLDLSRPGYSSVTNQVTTDTRDFQDYSAFGDLNDTTISEFKTLFDAQAAKAKAVDAFGGDPLNPDILGLTAAPED